MGAYRSVAAVAAATLIGMAANAAGSGKTPDLLLSSNPSGIAATFTTSGTLDLSNPFFQKLGTNGRSCDTCHQLNQGWSVTPAEIRKRFDATAGTDPIFRLNDGSNSPLADISTVDKRRAAFSMLLAKGLIRVGIGIPPGAEFELVQADDPYGFASAGELSLFRRPLPSANLKFLNTVMWDGRETFADASSGDCIRGTTRCFASLHFDLSDQSNGATMGHAQATAPLTPAQRDAIVGFEMSLFTAQVQDTNAKSLTGQGGLGGPLMLAGQDAYFGINDVLAGDYQTGAPFDPNVLRIYDAWASLKGGDQTTEARRAVARGQVLFNTKRIEIRGVKGINDDLAIDMLPGTCTTCHDTPGAGNHSIPMPLDIGLTDASRATPDLPLYLLRNKTTGQTVLTTDPGRALITGKWSDIGRFKGPTLRSLASRAPYFHNGSAASVEAVVDFYDQRFAIGLTAAEKADLAAFLRAL